MEGKILKLLTTKNYDKIKASLEVAVNGLSEYEEGQSYELDEAYRLSYSALVMYEKYLSFFPEEEEDEDEEDDGLDTGEYEPFVPICKSKKASQK